MLKTKLFKNYESLIDVKLLTSLIITVMLIFSIFFIQDSIINTNTDEDNSSTLDVEIPIKLQWSNP